jgi:hypothetical protein
MAMARSEGITHCRHRGAGSADGSTARRRRRSSRICLSDSQGGEGFGQRACQRHLRHHGPLAGIRSGVALTLVTVARSNLAVCC